MPCRSSSRGRLVSYACAGKSRHAGVPPVSALSAQIDVNGDTVLDEDDDTDGDGLPDFCDPVFTSADADGDGFKDSVEVFVGTNPGDFCSFPPDLDGNGGINIIDVLWMKSPFNSYIDEPRYRANADLNADSWVNIIDVLTLKPVFNTSCPYPIVSQPAIARLMPSSTHHHRAPLWWTTFALVRVADFGPIDPATFCDEVAEATGHWSNNTDFAFGMSVDASTGLCTQFAFPEVVVTWQDLDDALGGTALWDAFDGHACSGANPCQRSIRGQVILNSASPSMTGSASNRKIVLAHEFGHVLGQDHPPGCSDWSIMFEFLSCLQSQGVSAPRQNDIVFTNVKY